MKQTPPTTVRIPAFLRKKIDRDATKNHRSFNGQLIAIIEAAYKRKEKTNG